MAPWRLWIQASAAVGQARGQIQVFVSNFKQGLRLIRIEVGDLTILFGRAVKVILSQVIQSHGLVRIQA